MRYRGMADPQSDLADQINQSWLARFGVGIVDPYTRQTDINFARYWVQNTLKQDVSQMSDAQVRALYNAHPLGGAIGGGATAAAEALNPLNWEILGIPFLYWLLIGGAIFVLKR